MSIYPKLDYEIGRDSGVLQPDRLSDKRVQVKPNLPGSVIVIHGVNDVGVSFNEVEKGLCAGLNERLSHGACFQGASYRMPGTDDKGKLETDPDAVFFKRQLQEGHHTPVIPFYWGYREESKKAGTNAGQAVDRYGNRLDKDLSKGGGPFANATGTLVDMWNKGFGSGPYDVVDRISKDPLRPVLNGPGRMYMILAAKRLAALISMIRDYDPDEAVSIVAHSQGCMVSLLAQAFLMQQGLRPADTLVLTHPPYSLVAAMPFLESLGEGLSGGEDQAMRSNYELISGRQTVNARLQTLANIVQGVVQKKHAAPALTALTDHGTHRGMVGARWQASDDRDNRGKVYLYFCPEDMTVALNTLQGIGWQGVPDYVSGPRTTDTARAALDELMKLNGKDKGFFQRVFTAKLRRRPGVPTPQPVLVGAPPQDFALRVEGESAHGHADAELDSHRASAPEVDPRQNSNDLGIVPKSAEALRHGIRRITGEPLKTPVKADMHAGAIPGTSGQREAVDPIDAAISSTSRYGYRTLPQQLIDDPRPAAQRTMLGAYDDLSPYERDAVTQALNKDKDPGDRCTLERASYAGKGKVLIVRYETPNEVRLRQQQTGTSARSFHSAIFGSMVNHQQVTAYDIAIGGGNAVSDPLFYGYLCAVADWRLKKPKPNDSKRPGILLWKQFGEQFAVYYFVEPDWRKALIEANCDYYSTGQLPESLPVLPAGLPLTVVSETMSGRRIDSPSQPKPVKIADVEPKSETIGEWRSLNSGMVDGGSGNIA